MEKIFLPDLLLSIASSDLFFFAIIINIGSFLVVKKTFSISINILTKNPKNAFSKKTMPFFLDVISYYTSILVTTYISALYPTSINIAELNINFYHYTKLAIIATASYILLIITIENFLNNRRG
ncbi:hypothetical protein L2W58_03490 [Dethiosulfovibrio sp. F2B]|uniref:hypothetical protein n=1 Tax=Dethiosulfovibrio faecalis TaxID=2720018 RepID=UPI001F270680|nr:hypothetical protein [Dethiosulfovibrio faecalis]MCF4150854.1 hypothetical protein [Dethiosulfovibrio faecalis]